MHEIWILFSSYSQPRQETTLLQWAELGVHKVTTPDLTHGWLTHFPNVALCKVGT